MKKTIKNIIEIIGLACFILGICSADSECLLFPICMTFGGIAILYWTTKDYEESEDDDSI